MARPLRVGLEIGAQVRHAVFQHGETVDAQPEGEALMDCRIEPAIAQHIRMHHAAAQHFQPVRALADFDNAAGALALHVHLGRRLRERKEVRAETCRHIVDLEEGLHEIDEATFQVAHVDAFLDDEAFHLVEHRRVGRVPVIAEHAARHEDADRRLFGHHGAHLHRTRMGTEHFRQRIVAGLQEEGVMRLARRVAFGEVQRREIVPVVLDVRAFGHAEAHVAEDRGDFLEHLHHRMQRPFPGQRGRWQGQVHFLTHQLGFQRNRLQRALARAHGVFNPHLQRVERRALFLALFGRHRAERAHQAGDPALLAEFGDAYRVQRVKAGGGLNGGQRFLLDGCNVGQVKTLPENQRAV